MDRVGLGISVVVTVGLTVILFGTVVRRLLGEAVSVPRLLGAGFLGFSSGSLLTQVVDPDAPASVAAWFLTVYIGVAVLVTMSALVLAEIVVPTGSRPRPLRWSRAARGGYRRTGRYLEIARIANRHGLWSIWRRRVRAPRDAGERRQFARSVRAALEEAGPTFVKVGQVMSTRPDLLPAELVDELSELQDAAAPVAWDEIAAVLEAELGPLGTTFAHVDPVPVAAASVAQVHRATLLDGTEVVVKVVRPGIDRALAQDLDIVVRLGRTLEARTAWGRTGRAADLAAGFADAVLEEVDLRVEARNLVAVRAAAAAGPTDIHVPEPYPAVSTRRVLVMERLVGSSVRDGAARLSSERRTALARALLGSVLAQVLEQGLFHADPHPGNVLVLDGPSGADGGLGLLDLGSVGRLGGDERGALVSLLAAIDRGDGVAVRDALLEVVGRPDELDGVALQRALSQFMARHLGPASAPSATLFTDLLRLVADFGLAVPRGTAAVFRSLATLEGTLTLLAPGLDLVVEARAYASRRLGLGWEPETLRHSLTHELVALAPVLRRLPARLDRISAALDDGRLTVNVRLFDDASRRFLHGLVSTVLMAFLAAGTGLMGILLLGTEGGPVVTTTTSMYDLIGYNLMLVSAILLLRVLFSILRREC